MKIMQEEHDVPTVGHRGGQTTRVVVGKKILLTWNERGRKAFRAHLCEVSEHEIHFFLKVWII